MTRNCSGCHDGDENSDVRCRRDSSAATVNRLSPNSVTRRITAYGPCSVDRAVHSRFNAFGVSSAPSAVSRRRLGRFDSDRHPV
jgi:hypothetical protein